MTQRNFAIPKTPVRVRPQDRLLDMASLLMVAGGVLLFALGRAQLRSLAANTYAPPPPGVTWVSRAELHDAQTRWGALLAGAGAVLAAGAALKHHAARRRVR